jgi:hypothetical protein
VSPSCLAPRSLARERKEIDNALIHPTGSSALRGGAVLTRDAASLRAAQKAPPFSHWHAATVPDTPSHVLVDGSSLAVRAHY